jgi:hypothetical protein
MREADKLKIELTALSNILKDFVEINRDKMSSKAVLIHDLRDIGFSKIGDGKWALDLKMHGVSYVSFLLVFRGTAVDITEDHIIIVDGVETPVSKIRKPFTLTAVRYSRVVSEMLKRVEDLSKEMKGEADG